MVGFGVLVHTTRKSKEEGYNKEGSMEQGENEKILSHQVSWVL